MSRSVDSVNSSSREPGTRVFTIPRLYAIVDHACLQSPGNLVSSTVICDFARQLAEAGVDLIQYRAKHATSREILSVARELKRTLPPGVKLIMNDRADLCIAAAFDGLHLGQDDLSPDAARRVVGPHAIIGVSTHNLEQLRHADGTSADYLAIGPIFATSSKANPDPVVGIHGVRAARAATRKPLVAIGGITRQNCRSVLDAGADSVAVISDLVNDPRRSVEEFLRILL